MARFRGTVQGNRGEASRLGSAKSGLTTETNGWDVGVVVEAMAHENGDEFHLHVTGGSNGRKLSRFIGYVDTDGVFWPNKSS